MSGAAAGLRVGVLGLGRVGRMHAAHLIRADGVEEVVLIGRDAGRLDEAAAAVEEEVAAASAPAAEGAPERAGAGRAPGAPSDVSRRAPGSGRARVSRRLADGRHLEGLDGLVIATSTASHPGLVREAVAAGVPLLVEKPLALELEEQDALVAELEASPVPIMMAYHRRYDPAYRDLRERVRTGEMGRIRLVHAVSHDHHHVTADYIGPSGGIWRDLVIHDLDTVPWLLGEEVEAVYATGTAIDEPAYAEHGDLDTATAILSFRSGAQAVISAARNIAAGHDVRTEVYGSDGAYATGLDGLTPVVSTEPGTQAPAETHEEFTDRFARAFRAEADHFVSMLRGEAESLTPPAQCAGALRLALAAEESVRTGAPVRV